MICTAICIIGLCEEELIRCGFFTSVLLHRIMVPSNQFGKTLNLKFLTIHCKIDDRSRFKKERKNIGDDEKCDQNVWEFG